MTKLEVFDTAVKIGLGAALTGIFSFLLARRDHSHELDKEVMRRRQDLLERISSDFEAFHQVVIEIYTAHATHRNSLEALKIEPGKGPVNDKLHEAISRLTPALKHCHTLEGQLMLLGMSEAASRLMSYRLAVTDLQSLPGLFGSGPSAEEFKKMTNACAVLRNEFYAILQKFYCSPVR